MRVRCCDEFASTDGVLSLGDDAWNTAAGQDTLFDVWRFHAFLTTTSEQLLDTLAADKTRRGHAISEHVNADLKGSALSHLPSGELTTNAASLALAALAFNLTRAAAPLTGAPGLAKATTATIRRTLIHVPARVAASALRLVLHSPTDWPWEQARTELFIRVCGPPPATARTSPQPATARPSTGGTQRQRGRAITHAPRHLLPSRPPRLTPPRPSLD